MIKTELSCIKLWRKGIPWWHVNRSQERFVNGLKIEKLFVGSIKEKENHYFSMGEIHLKRSRTRRERRVHPGLPGWGSGAGTPSHPSFRSFFPSHWVYDWIKSYDLGLRRWSGMRWFPEDFFRSANRAACQKIYLNNDCISIKRHCSWAIAKNEMWCRQSLNLVGTLSPLKNFIWLVWDTKIYTDSHLKAIVIRGKKGQ